MGKPNITALVKQIQRLDDHFIHLSQQRVGEWRDPSVENKIVWSKKTIEEVKKGFLPGGIQTQFNVFVSFFEFSIKCLLTKMKQHNHPGVCSQIKTALTSLQAASVCLDLSSIRGVMI